MFFNVLVNVLCIENTASHIPVRVEFPAIRITEISLTCFLAVIKPPLFLGDQVKRAATALEAAVIEVDKRLESVEGILSQLADFIFFAFAIRFVVRDYYYISLVSQHNIVISPHFLRDEFL